jgi:hypothetical protein
MTTPIDSSLPPGTKEVFYFLDPDGVWKTSDLSSSLAAATWTHVLDLDTFQFLAGCTQGVFLRIVAATVDIVYLLAAGKIGDTYTVYCGSTINGGSAWSFSIVEEGIYGREYTVDYQTITKTMNDYLTVSVTHRRHDEDPVAPWALAWNGYGSNSKWDKGGWWNDEGDSLFINDFEGSNEHWNVNNTAKNSSLDSSQIAQLELWLDDFFGIGNWVDKGQKSMPTAETRVKHGAQYEIVLDESGTFCGTFYSFWNTPEVRTPKALAVAPTNSNWVYIGLLHKIVKSEDGGETWDTFCNEGAFDICVDPLSAGAVYFWSTEGNLELCVNRVVVSSSLLTEEPNEDFGRIAKEPYGLGRLYVLQDGMTLQVRSGGAWTTLQSGLSRGCGLHAYLGGKLIFVDVDRVYISNDGVTVMERSESDLGTNIRGVNVHRMDV